jgi:hypothetical protein
MVADLWVAYALLPDVAGAATGRRTEANAMRPRLLGFLVLLAAGCSATVTQPMRATRTHDLGDDQVPKDAPPQKLPPVDLDAGAASGTSATKPTIDGGAGGAGLAVDLGPTNGCGTVTYDGVCEAGRVKYCVMGTMIAYVECGPTYPCQIDVCAKGAACCPKS